MPENTSKNSPWSAEMVYAYGLYRRIGRVLGTWPLKCQDLQSTCAIIFACFTQITMVIEIVGEAIITTVVNPQYISCMTCNILSLIKMLSVRMNRRKLQEVLDDLLEAWGRDVDEEALKIMQKAARLGRNVCIYEVGTTYVSIVPMMVGALPLFAPVVNQTMNVTTELILRPYPLQTSYIFADIPTWLYCFVFVYQSVQLFATVTGNVGNDCWFFGMAMNLCAQIEVLQHQCQNLTASCDDSTKKNLSIIIQRHNHLIKLVQHLEDAYNFVIFTIVAVNVSQVCFYGIQLIRCIRTGDFVVVINTLIFIGLLNFQIFLYSWAGGRLSSLIQDMDAAAYNCPWYEWPQQNRKDLIFIMTRSTKIFTLTAGKIYPMNCDSFKNIMKMILSYFSVMQAMFEE